MSGPERTGWRDENLSRRHREWGFHCPAVDLGFLLIEYDTGEAHSSSHPGERAIGFWRHKIRDDLIEKVGPYRAATGVVIQGA